MDLKYYTELSSKDAKSFKNSSSNKDNHYEEKYEVYRILHNEFEMKKIYYNKSLQSFILIFAGAIDEKDVYSSLARIKKGYGELQFDLSIEYNPEEEEEWFVLQYNYETQKLLELK